MDSFWYSSKITKRFIRILFWICSKVIISLPIYDKMDFLKTSLFATFCDSLRTISIPVSAAARRHLLDFDSSASLKPTIQRRRIHLLPLLSMHNWSWLRRRLGPSKVPACCGILCGFLMHQATFSVSESRQPKHNYFIFFWDPFSDSYFDAFHFGNAGVDSGCSQYSRLRRWSWCGYGRRDRQPLQIGGGNPAGTGTRANGRRSRVWIYFLISFVSTQWHFCTPSIANH